MPLRNRLAVIASAAAVFAAGVTALTTAHADHQPVIVVPGRPDVPVIIDGVDARGAVVVGDWGLYRPGSAPSIEPGPLLIGRALRTHSYYPATGRPARYGRLEVHRPAGRRPATVESFYRSWSSESSPMAAAGYPWADPPEVITAARDRLKPRRHGPFK